MRTSPVHYIAPSAISIVPNCNGTSSDLAVTISRGTKIKVYSPRAGIDKTTDGEYQEWTIAGRNRRLAGSTAEYTIYARLSRWSKDDGYLIFAPKVPNGDDWLDKYRYITTDGLTDYGYTADSNTVNANNNYYFVRLGDVSLPDANNPRTVTLDTGILGTDQFNDEWSLRPDELPLRIELGCTINDEDVGQTPYVYWGQSLVLTAMLTEGWTGTDIQRFDHWEITRDSGDSNADNVWNHPTGAGSYHGLTDGQIILTHARGYGDDFNGAVSATFTVVAMGHPEEGSESQNLVALKTAVINIHAETVEKYELAMTANIVGYNPMTQTYDPASITILIRATDQRGDVFELTNGQYDNAGLEVQYAAVGSSGWRTLDFTGASTDVATATLDTATFFAAKQSINVRLMRIVETDGSTAIELTQQTIAFVRDGEDSKVREWIYRLNSNAGYNSTTGTANGQAVSGQTGGVDNCLLTDDFVPTGWSDDPTGVSQPGDVEWESWRDYDDENHRWGVFHTPVIHNRYAEDGKSITKQSETLTYAVTAASDDHPTADSGDWKSTKSAAITAYNTAHSISGSDWQQDTVMWTKTDILWSDNSHTILYSGERNPNDGNPGMSIVIDSQSVTYCRRTAAQGPVSDPSTLRYGSYPSTLTKGDWLYSKTVIVYKTSGGAAAGTTTSYAVSYIGIDGDNGVGISGLTEHYLASDKNYGETGAPTTPSGTNPTDWGTSPMPSNPSWDADHPYLWNYEKIAKVDKDGTTYERTDASVIAIWTENGKGIDSITNFYKKSSLGTGVGFPAADPDGSGTAHSGGTATGWSAAVQVPDADAPYLWNYERITWIEPDGSNTYTYTDPHVIGHFGKDGENSIRIDLDNEHEDFLYDDAGVRKSGIATSQARLYDGTTAKTTGVTWAVSCFDDDNHWVSQGDTYTDTNAKAKISSSGLLTVEEIYVQSAKVRVRATYNSKYYYAAFTANRTSQDKYELVLSPNSIPCNLSSYEITAITVSARRLDLQGNLTDIGFGAYTNPSKISTSSSRGYLRLFCAWVTGGTVGTKTSQWNNTFNVFLSDAVDHDGVYFELRKYDSPTASNDSDYKIVDYETVPILIVVNGTSPWVADLDNEMDSVVCDSDGTVSSPQNVSTNVSLCYGSTPKPFSVGVFSDAACTNAYDNGTEDVGVTVSWTSGYNTANTIQIALAQGDVTISGKMEFYIRLTAQEDNSVQRTLCFTVNGLRPGADGKSPTIYNLLPSTNQISVGRTDSGGYNPSTATLTCGYTSKTGNSSPTVVSEAGNRTGDYGIGGAYNIYFRRHNRGSEWETYYYCYTYIAATYRNYLSGFNVSAYDKVEFVICTDTAYRITTPSNVIDRETVPVVSDGAQGTPGTIYQRMYCSNNNGTWSGSLPADYVEGSNGWHIAPTATTPSARYRWVTERRSDDGGTSWGNGWSTPQIDAYLAENGTSISIKGQATAVIPWGESLPASSTNGNLYLMNNEDADSINQYNNGTWDAVAASIGDGYLVDGHLWMKVRETATASSLRWQDAGQIKGEKGEDGWMIAASPANVILTQNLVTVNTFSAATVSFTAKKGNTPATVASISIRPQDPSTFIVSNVGVTAVVTAPDKDSNDNYYTEGSFIVDVYVTDPDSGDTVMFTLTVPCYANLLGTWKETVENDTKTEVASQITYGYDNNTGEVGTLQAIGKYIKSSQLYISRIEKTVSGADRNLVVNGAFMSGALNWEEWGTPTTREIYKDTTGRKWMRIVSTTTRYQGYMQRKYSDYGIMVHGGETYTVSLRAKSSSGSARIAVGFHWYRGTEALMSGGSIVQTWKEFTINATEAVYSYTFTVPSDADNFNIMVGDNTTTAQNFFITEIKLELGEIATAWTPNSVDAYSEIRQTADNINLTVNNLSNATQTALNLKADSADLTAMQDGLETAGVHLDGNNSVINLKAGKVNFVDPNGDAYATPKVNIDPTDGALHAVDGYFSGEVHATSGDFVNVKVSGGMRSPFTYITPNSTFNNDFSDNLAIYSTADNKDENDEAIPTPYNIPWDSSQSGRRIIVANYKWGNGTQVHTGYVKINAPAGKYFFEDGILKPSIYMSREVIELIGYGDSSNFYGWIVLTRTDLGTNRSYGHNIKVLAMGVVTVTGTTNADITAMGQTFDKSSLSLVRNGVGKYTITFGNTNWFENDADVFVMVTGCGSCVEASGNPIYANLNSKNKYGFTVWTGDDDSLNDGSFNFIVMNFSDWSSIVKNN